MIASKIMKIYVLYIAPYCGSNDGGDFDERLYAFTDLKKAGKRLLKEMKEWMSQEQLEQALKLLENNRVYDLVAMNKEHFPGDKLFEFEVET